MTTTRAGSLAAALGGLLWVVAALAGWGGDSLAALYVVGAVFLAGAVGVAGYSLVASAPVWLRAVISVAAPAFAAMVWVSVVAVFDDDFTAVLVAGLVALALGAMVLRRSSAAAAPAGSHRAAGEPDASTATS